MKVRWALCAALVLAYASRAWADEEPADPPSEASAPAPEPARVVVSAAGQASRFIAELERELRASSFTVVEVREVALEPEAMMAILGEAHASRGVRLSDDGQSVVVFTLTRGGRSLRVYGEYSVDAHDRLARRRQWISLVERLRVPPEDDAEDQDSRTWLRPPPPPEVATAPAATAPLTTGPEPPSPPAVQEASSPSGPSRLGAATTLGYARGNRELLSHLLLTGQKVVRPRLALFVAGLWPLVAGEHERNGIRSRAWTFTTSGGVLLDLGRPAWVVQPFVGLGLGLQFLVVYVDYQAGGQSDIEKTLSGVADLQLGTRIDLRPDMALLLQFSGARVVGSASATRTLADTWLARTSLGLLIDF